MYSLFVYGSLMSEEVLNLFIATPVQAVPAMLENYQRFAVIDDQYPGIVAAAGQQVEGVLLQGLSAEDMQMLDDYEGDQYERVAVSVLSHGESLACDTYVFKPEYRFRLSDKPWCYHEFREKYLQVYLERFVDW